MHEGKRVSHPAAFELAARIARWTARTWWLWLLMMTVATCLVVSLEVPSFHTIVGGTYHPDAMTMNAELVGQVSQEWLDAPSSTVAEERAKEDARARAAAYADYLAATEDRGRIGAAIKLMELSSSSLRFTRVCWRRRSRGSTKASTRCRRSCFSPAVGRITCAFRF